MRQALWGLLLMAAAAGAAAQAPTEPLPDGAIQRLGTLRLRYTAVTDMLYLPDGRALILAGNSLETWDMEQGVRVAQQALPLSPVCMQLKRDNRTVLLADSAGSVREWDTGERKVVRSLDTGMRDLRYATLSPDEQRLLTTQRLSPTITEWDLQTGRALVTMTSLMAYAGQALYLPDGRSAIVCGGYEKTMEHWDLATGKLLKTFSADYCVYHFALSADGTRLLAGSRSMATEWQLDGYKRLMDFKGHHGGAVTSESYAANPDELLTGSRDGSIRRWNRLTGKVVLRWFPHPSYCTVIRVSPDGKWVLSYGGGGFVVETSLATGQPRLQWDRHSASVEAVAFLPDGQVVSAAADATLRVWDVASAKTTRSLPATGLGAYAGAVSPDGTKIAAGYKDGMVREYTAADGALLRELSGHLGYVRSVAYTPDGRLLSSADDGSIRAWTAEPAVTLQGHRGGVLAIAVLPDGQTVASAGRDGTVRLWDLSTAKQVWSKEKHHGWVSALTWSGNELLSGGRDGRLIRWDRAGNVLGEIPVGGWINALAAVPGRAYAAVGGSVVPCDLTTNQAAPLLTGHAAAVNGLAMARDGKSFASASADTTLLVWKNPPRP